jgi:sterol 3beta-glucosyltransferase
MGEAHLKKITILCLGTRGDVQPYVALALGLQRRGWTPKIAAPVNLAAFVEQFGVECHPFDVDTEKGLKSPEGRAWLSAGKTRAFLRRIQELIRKDRPALEKGFWEASQGADALIGTVMTLGAGMSLAEKLEIPFIGGLTFPMLPPTGEWANLFVRSKAFPFPFLNRASHWLFDQQAWSVARADHNAWRLRMGLQPLRRSFYRWIEREKILMLHHYSPTLVPRPGEWGDHHIVTGPLYLSDALPPLIPRPPLDARLQQFLRDGTKPVFLGFGSMPILDAGRVLRMTAKVTEQLGIRAVIGAGWSEFNDSNLPPRLHLIESTDHDQLFPLCQALVHHGGAGTTAAGLHWGKPALVFSVFADQPFWGERLAEAGAGAHFRFKFFSEATLASGLRHVLEPAVQRRAQELGERFRAEAGLERSLEAIGARLEGGSSRAAVR